MEPPATATSAGVAPAYQKTFGDKDRHRVALEMKAAALAQYLEGVGQRATERLLGGSHNSWVKQAVFGQALKPTPAERVEWVEADELWTYIAQKRGWLRNCLTPRTSSSPPTSGTLTARSLPASTTFKARRTPLPSKV